MSRRLCDYFVTVGAGAPFETRRHEIIPVLPKTKTISRKRYEKELLRLQTELVELQEWVVTKGQRVVVIFEGRDTAGKGGVIKRIQEHLNPRVCRVAALSAPDSREKTQWYFQRYAAQLPSAGEIVLFDRSWYNRAGVERVMGFASEEQIEEFLRFCPLFEEALQQDGILLLKYWLSVSDEEQERRFTKRLKNPTKRWKFSPMDLQARARWVDYAQAKDVMMARTDTDSSPWWVVEGDDKRSARLNLISHLLDTVPWKRMPEDEKIVLPPRQQRKYKRPPKSSERQVPELYNVEKS